MNRSEYTANLDLQPAQSSPAWQAASTCKRTAPRQSRFGLVVVLSVISALVHVFAN